MLETYLTFTSVLTDNSADNWLINDNRTCCCRGQGETPNTCSTFTASHKNMTN